MNTARIRQWSLVVVALYIVALHTSIAGMEILAWLLVVIRVAYRARQKYLPPFEIGLPALGLFLTVAVGLLLNPGGRGFFFQLGFLRWIPLLYVFADTLAEYWSPEVERHLVKVWTIMVLISGAYALFQTVTGIDFIRPAAHVVAYEGGVWRPTGFFSRSLSFAYSFGFSYLALSLPRFRWPPLFWGWAVAGLGLATVVGTEARGAWLGLLAAGLVFCLVARPRYFIGFVALVAIIGAGMLASHTALGEKLGRMLSLTMDNSSDIRVHLWRAYYAMWKDHPFFGIGLLQGDLNLPAYYAKLGIHEEFVSHSHNVYLQWLAGAGVFGLFFYLWLCAYFLRLAWRLRKTTAWGWSLLLAQVYLHVGALTENSFFTAITNHMVIFGWAILLALSRRSSSTNTMAQMNTSI
jgi:O-antigen ligase